MKNAGQKVLKVVFRGCVLSVAELLVSHGSTRIIWLRPMKVRTQINTFFSMFDILHLPNSNFILLCEFANLNLDFGCL